MSTRTLRHPNPYPLHSDVLDFVAKFATEDPIDILDIGGRNLNGSPRSYYPRARYTVMDLRPGPDVDIVADAATWEPEGKWDLVLCTEVFEHTPEWRAILATAARALRPGGRLVATCASGSRAPHSGIEATSIRPGEFYQNVQPDEMEAALQEQGWRQVSVATVRNGLDLQATAVKAGRPPRPTHFTEVIPQMANKQEQSDQILEATESYAVDVDGVPQIVHAGRTRVTAGHPLHAAKPEAWKPIEVSRSVEQATAAPGEKRGA